MREAKLSQSLPSDKVPTLGRSHSAESETDRQRSPPNVKVPALGIPGRIRSASAESAPSQGKVNGKLPLVDSGGGGPAKAVLADGETGVPRPSVWSKPAPSREPEMTVEDATQLVLGGAMKWPSQLEA